MALSSLGERVNMTRASKPNILVQFGKRLRELREAAQLTQEALAFQSGLDRSYVGQVERGERNIALINIGKLAQALGVPPEEMLKFTPDEATEEQSSI